MTALHRRFDHKAALAIVATVLLVGLAGCSGITTPVPGAGDAPATTPEPPVSESDAEDRALSAEREHVREHKIPEDVDSWGWGGIATSRSRAVEPTNDGWFVRVRVGFYYNTNTSEGELHADGLTKSMYFVTANDTTRVSLPGHEMKGSAVGGGPASLAVRVVSVADGTSDVSLSIQGPNADTVYEGESTVGGGGAVHAPRLAVSDGTYEVVATVDGHTERLDVTVGNESGSPAEVTVFVAPDGSVILTRTASHP